MFRLHIERSVRRFANGLMLAMAAFSMVAAAQAADLMVRNVWIREPMPGQSVAAAYMTLESTRGMALVKADSPVAGVVELHRMWMDHGIMRMRAMPRIDLPAGQAVRLTPGGLHVMLIDLRRTLRVGEYVPLTLVFEDAQHAQQKISVQAEVRAFGRAPSMRMPAH